MGGGIRSQTEMDTMKTILIGILELIGALIVLGAFVYAIVMR